MTTKQFNENLKKKIFEKIQNDLFPKVHGPSLLVKIFFLHLLATAFVLAICPQFGFGLFKNGHFGLSALFMHVSMEFCHLACGFLLSSTSLLTLLLSLKLTEKEWLLENKWAFHAVLFLLTASFFWMFSPQIFLFDLVIWGAGALSAELAFFPMLRTA